MKTAMTLENLVQTVASHEARKQDWNAPAGQLRMEVGKPTISEDGVLSYPPTRLRLGDDTVLGISPNAHSQVASRMEIPKKYYDRMLMEKPDLLVTNVNEWLLKASKAEVGYFVRSLDGKARAFLSSRYAVRDNADLLRAVIPTIQKQGLRIVSANVDADRFYLKAVSEKIVGDVVGQVVQAGLVIRNSEVGRSALSCTPLIYTLACTNGMVTTGWGAAALRRSHVGKRNSFDNVERADVLSSEAKQAEAQAFWLGVRDTVGSFLSQENLDAILAPMRSAQEQTLVIPAPQVVERVAERFGFTSVEGDRILAHLLSGTGGGHAGHPNMTRMGLIDSVTRSAQDSDDYERASELERIGGRLLGLPAAEWRQLAVVN